MTNPRSARPAPAAAGAPLEARLRALHATLPAAERCLADAVLAHRDSLLGYSATELSSLAGVSKASAARFFRRLGFADFQAFRAAVRAESAAAVPLHRLAEPGAGAPRRSRRPDLQAELAAHAQRDQQLLQRLPLHVDAPALDAALALLADARQVLVLGYRNAHTVAVYAQSLLHQLRPQVGLLVDPAARETERLADLGSGDLLFVVDLRRRVTRLQPLVQAARGGGAQVLLLTDAPLSPLEPLADVVLRCPTHDAQLFDAYVAPISLVNFLAAALAARCDRPARRRLAHIETLHGLLHDLDVGGAAVNR